MEKTLKSPIDLLSDLLVDIGRFDPGVRGLDRDLLTIKSRFEKEGIGFLTVALPSFGKAFDKALAMRRLSPLVGFGTLRKGNIPKLFSGMLSELFDPITGILVEKPSLSIIKSVRQVCYLYKKLQLTQKNERKLDSAAKLKFWKTDEAITRVNIEPRLLSHFHRVCTYILPNLDGEEDLKYKNGPGAVAEKVLSNGKWTSIFKEITTGDFNIDGLGLDGVVQWTNPLNQESQQQVAPSRLARLVTVPKSATARRTITIEPAIHQYVQQGLNDRLRREILRCPILRQCLALTDQSKNQKLALDGSLTTEWTTLDLSSASDLLSCDTVKRTFWKHTSFTEKMFRCRTSAIDDGKSHRTMEKFGGMGNALTFPVQSIVFAMLCIAAITDMRRREPKYRDVLRAAGSVRVYGDDIIVRTSCFHQVVYWFESFGFIINQDKTFSEGNFRESCGVDAFMGVDVTPIYLKLDPSSKLDPTSRVRLVETSNALWHNCYYSLSTALISDRKCKFFKNLPLKTRDDGFVGLENRLNARTFTSWSKRYQRPVTRAYQVKSLYFKDELDDLPALLKSLTTPLIGRERSHLSRVSRKYSTRVVTMTH